MTKVMEVLELARWAPSGDNSQPWRFAVQSEDHVVVLGSDTRRHCVYDLDGHPSQISIGALLETIALAATRFGWRADIERRSGGSDEHPVFDVRFRPEAGLQQDPLVAQITERRVQRRALLRRRLASTEKSALEAAVAPEFACVWFEPLSERARLARLNVANAKIRLTLPEAYSVHRDVIEWDAQQSETRVPDSALGASRGSLRLMRWALGSWGRVSFLNRYLGGTVMPRLELDLLPGLACAAHCVLLAKQPPASIDDYVAAGRALQRFWLTATALGLQFQPQYTPLVFARYARGGVSFTRDARRRRDAEAIRQRLDALLGSDAAQRAVFMGRIGAGAPATARSVRRPLRELMVAEASSRPA